MLSLFWFMANLEQSGHRIPDAQSVKHIFINSNLLSYKNLKTELKISNTALTTILWVKLLFSLKNDDFMKKYADIIKIKRALILKFLA